MRKQLRLRPPLPIEETDAILKPQALKLMPFTLTAAILRAVAYLDTGSIPFAFGPPECCAAHTVNQQGSAPPRVYSSKEFFPI